MKRVSTLAVVVIAVGLGVASVQSQGRQSQNQGAGDAIVKLDPALDAIVPAGAKVEVLKPDYFGISEGPVWIREGAGYLLFSDIGANMIYKWTPDGQLSTFLDKAGFTGTDAMAAGVGVNSFNGRLIVWNYGPNGLALDPQGRLVVAQQGDRAIMRVEKDGTHTILADRFEGKRLNGPNDLVVKSDGAVYFSDPGSALRADSPQRELPYRGTFMVKDGKVQLLEKELPSNGVVFSPDEKQFYMSGGGQISRYDVQPDGTLTNRQPFGTGGCDGMKVDQKGNLYCSASTNGVAIFSPAGKQIGTIRTPDNALNVAFGDADYKTLYITARKWLCRIRLNIPGTHF